MSEPLVSYGEQPSPTALSTAWIPLEGLCTQWSEIGREASATGLLQITGQAFQALSAEDQAHLYVEQAQFSPSPATQMCNLDRAAEALLQARQCWSDALLALEVQTDKLHTSSHNRQLATSLLANVWQERVRITALLLQVEQAQASCQQDCSFACARKSIGKDG